MGSLLIFLLLPLIASIAGTRLVLSWLRHRQILDHPNERSSHSQPTPRGGGLAVTPVILLAWLGCFIFVPNDGGQPWVVVVGAVLLLVLSWIDDRRGLPAGLRLCAHILVVTAGLAAWSPDQLLCQGWLPFWADRLVGLGAWVWFVNLFNFMDGIDGISGVEAVTVACGLAGSALLGGDFANATLAVAMAGAAFGFLVWNWQPARIFLGDSGSVPIGYLLGWLLLSAAGDGHWAAALILPSYYLADATLTLGRRALRGEPLAQAHRQHFYQKAVQGGASHARVSGLILLTNIVLIGLAWLADFRPLWALLAAAATVALLLAVLGRLGRGAGR